jgi:hypothetical protein
VVRLVPRQLTFDLLRDTATKELSSDHGVMLTRGGACLGPLRQLLRHEAKRSLCIQIQVISVHPRLALPTTAPDPWMMPALVPALGATPACTAFVYNTSHQSCISTCLRTWMMPALVLALSTTPCDGSMHRLCIQHQVIVCISIATPTLHAQPLYTTPGDWPHLDDARLGAGLGHDAMRRQHRTELPRRHGVQVPRERVPLQPRPRTGTRRHCHEGQPRETRP